MIKEAIKRLARTLCGEYAIYRICTCSATDARFPVAPLQGLAFVAVDAARVESSADEIIREQTWYHGEGSRAYACLEGAKIVALCFFWHGERYHTRNFWPLKEQEAMLVQIVTLPEMRSRGIARALIAHAARDMLARGFHRLYARIWHSNMASLRAFEGAGWRLVASVIEIHPFGRKKPLRIVCGRKR